MKIKFFYYYNKDNDLLIKYIKKNKFIYIIIAVQGEILVMAL